MTAAVGQSTPPAEWYLARDGQQFGPLSDAELRKLVEFGHLKPTDLLWREGFPDWRPARILLPDDAVKALAEEAAAADPTPQPVTQPAVAVQAATVQPSPAAQAQPAQVKPVVEAAAPKPAPAQAPVQPQPQATPAPAARPIASQPAPAQQVPTWKDPKAWQAANEVPVGQPYAGQPQPTQPQPQARAPMAPVQPAPAPRPMQQPSPQGMTLRNPNAGPQAQPYNAPLPAPQPMPPLAAQPPLQTRPIGPAAAQGTARPMDLARPAQAAPVSAQTRKAGAAPVHRPGDDTYDDEDEDIDDEPRSGIGLLLKRAAVIIFFVSTLGAATWYAYPHRERIFSMASAVASFNASAPTASPIGGFQAAPEATDDILQKAPLWRTLKREFPEWYGERIKQASEMSRAQKSDPEIGQEMMQSVMALRRKHAGDALSATMPRLKAVAAAFADNLVRLRQVSPEACHGFISTGETSPAYMKLLADTSHSGALQAQLTAVFDAVADGRKLPRIYPQPKQTDYNLLVTALEARGWTEADMQLFSDSRKFGQASPTKVCQMVTDWFQAQLELKDADAQLRLLADALKPVIAG